MGTSGAGGEPRRNEATMQHDLIIIGAGPGGYVAAVRAAEQGLNVGIVDENDLLGGTCLRVGCIPSKALLESSERFHETQHALAEHGIKVKGVELDLAAMLKRKDEVVGTLASGIATLFKMHKVKSYQGRGRITAPGKVTVEGKDNVELTAKNILIATGSVPASLPGVKLDGDRIGTSTEALAYREVPKHLVVIGAGAIGLELGSVWSRLGAKVTVLEYLDRILPGMDDDLAREGLKLFKKQGMDIHLGVKVTGASVKRNKVTVQREGGDPIECDRLLVAVGRKPNTQGLGLDTVGVKLDERGRIVVDQHFRTNVEGIYAIGDVIAGPMLAHKAESEGVACVQHLAGKVGRVNYDAIPAVVYTNPEIGSVGKTEQELKQAGVQYRKGVYQFRANGRARAMAQTDGWAKVLADAATDRVLGVHIIGPRAGDLINEAVTAIEFGASAEDLALVCHAHPTLPEVLKEAAHAAHIAKR